MNQNVLLCFFYIEAQVISIILLTFILIRNSKSAKETKSRFLSSIIVSMIIYGIFDGLWALCFFNIVPNAQTLIKYTRIGYYIVGGIATYAWFMYLELVMESMVFNSRKLRLILLIPILVSTLLVIFLGLFGPDPTQKTIWSYLTVLGFTIIPFLYMIFASVHAIVMAFKKNTLLERKTYLRYGLYPILLMMLVFVQVYFQEIATLEFGTTLLLTALYINSQSKLVSTDSLTGLNNRNELNRYLAEAQEFNSLYIMMIDIDRFKTINDKFGHVEGDKAIRYVADCLKKSLSKSKQRQFLGRYGGDEFIIVARNTNDEEISELISIINKELKDGTGKSSDYEIVVSIGYSKKDDSKSIKDVIEEADKALYIEKEKHHRASR